ncbi:MAG: hypothetical protein HKN36_08930 [Hellea sp.]|nr:hypothetical protein [Hellea sp.]
MIWILLIMTAIVATLFLFAPLLSNENTNSVRKLSGLFTALMITGIVGTYAVNGRPDLTGEIEKIPTLSEEVAALKSQLYLDKSTDPGQWWVLARGQMKLEQYEDAIVSYEIVRILLPDNPELAEEYGSAITFIRQQMQASNEPTLSANEQMAMGANMTEGLAARLYEEGGSPEEWKMLLKARGVLGETEKRDADIAHIKTIYADQPKILAEILGE